MCILVFATSGVSISLSTSTSSGGCPTTVYACRRTTCLRCCCQGNRASVLGGSLLCAATSGCWPADKYTRCRTTSLQRNSTNTGVRGPNPCWNLEDRQMHCFGAVAHLCSSCKRCRSGWKWAIRCSTCCRFQPIFLGVGSRGLGLVLFSPVLILQALPQTLEAGHQVQQLLPQPGGRGGARARSAAARPAALHIRPRITYTLCCIGALRSNHGSGSCCRNPAFVEAHVHAALLPGPQPCIT